MPSYYIESPNPAAFASIYSAVKTFGIVRAIFSRYDPAIIIKHHLRDIVFSEDKHVFNAYIILKLQ